MKTYIDLFITFFKMGAVTFGGGYAMLPILEEEVVRRHQWATKEDLMNYYAVAQCTPGIIAINVSTFIGYYQKGILGAIASTMGIVFPSLIIITIIAAFLGNFKELEIIQHALSGLRIGVCAIVFTSILKLAKSGIKDLFGIGLFLLVFCVSLLSDISVIWITLFAMLCGVVKMKVEENKHD